MTESDYSPGAHQRYLDTQEHVGQWVRQTEPYRPQFHTNSEVRGRSPSPRFAPRRDSRSRQSSTSSSSSSSGTERTHRFQPQQPHPSQAPRPNSRMNSQPFPQYPYRYSTAPRPGQAAFPSPHVPPRSGGQPAGYPSHLQANTNQLHPGMSYNPWSGPAYPPQMAPPVGHQYYNAPRAVRFALPPAQYPQTAGYPPDIYPQPAGYPPDIYPRQQQLQRRGALRRPSRRPVFDVSKLNLNINKG